MVENRFARARRIGVVEKEVKKDRKERERKRTDFETEGKR